ncbi:MAG: acyltransferase ChoActase/COT/CPT [Piptocephalis tieghemiana]|nr:MAG: acyltransferase ChoActase/COT/CPT [Piptocephalis tieghemiana]
MKQDDSDSSACLPAPLPMDMGADQLPPLPVPDLQDTLDNYLESLKPLHRSNQDFDLDHTKRLIQEFARNEGPVLQAALERRSTEMYARGSSWLLDWWNEWAYDSGRASVCFAVNYCFGFRQDPRLPSQLQRATNLTSALLQFREQVKDRTLPADTIRGGKAMCMKQFETLFHGMKLPGETTDTTVIHPIHGNNHFVVSCNGHWYELPIYQTTPSPPSSPSSGPSSHHSLLTPVQLHYLLSKVMEDANARTTPGPNIGALTAQDRDTWFTDYYDRLLPLPGNAETMERLETAAFFLSLDPASPNSREEMSRACWHGVHPRDRYFDKCFQLLVFANGQAGFNGEHSRADGTSTARMSRDIVLASEGMDLIPDLSPSSSPSPSPSSSLPPPHHLPIQVDDSLSRAIDRAMSYWRSEVQAHDIWVLRYRGYGKGLMKKFKVSPDAYVQMALQLAYYRMHGVCRATYESAATRKFRAGRTETCRSVSEESLTWVESMTDGSGVSWAEKERLLRRAIGVHSKRTAKAVDGQGIDRHLLGLRLMASSMQHSKDEDDLSPSSPSSPLPPIFSDPAFTQSSYWYISTSQIAEPCIRTYAWGEVVPEGYGCAYMIDEDAVQVNICSRSRNSGQLGRWLEIALIDMRRVMEEGAKAQESSSLGKCSEPSGSAQGKESRRLMKA